MSEILSKCGYRCDLCLAYLPNIQENDRRQELSDGWYDIYGFRIEPEDILCEGCVSSETPRLIDTNCPVRPCAIARGFNTCAVCDEFVCDKHRQRGVRRSDLEAKLSRALSEREYELFVKPYEAEDRLMAIKKRIE